MNFFRSCRYNIEPISKTKNVLEPIFETCIFKGMNFCLREFLADFVQLIYWSGRVLLSFSFNSLKCISGLVLLCFCFVELFFALPFCRFFDIFLGYFKFSPIVLKALLNSSCSAKQFKTKRVSIKNQNQIQTG